MCTGSVPIYGTGIPQVRRFLPYRTERYNVNPIYLGVEFELDALLGHDALELFAVKEKKSLETLPTK